MIRHLVLLRFRSEISASEKAALMAELAALRDHLPGMLSFEPLVNVSPEHTVVHGFIDGFSIELVDTAARDAYLADPAHQAVGAKLTAACEGGRDGLIVFDHTF